MSNVISLNPPLKAKDGCPLRCVIVARISTEHQDPRSLEDQEAMCRKYVADHFDGRVSFIVISSVKSSIFFRPEMVVAWPFSISTAPWMKRMNRAPGWPFFGSMTRL